MSPSQASTLAHFSICPQAPKAVPRDTAPFTCVQEEEINWGLCSQRGLEGPEFLLTCSQEDLRIYPLPPLAQGHQETLKLPTKSNISPKKLSGPTGEEIG